MIPAKPELKPYEREIIELWRVGPPGEPWKWSYSAVSPKSAWIKGFLAEKGEAYVKEMFTAWLQFVEKAKEYGVKIKAGNYQTMKQHVWLLNKLGLVIPVRREPSKRKGYFKRTYYSLNPAKVDDPAWNRPLQTLYPRSDWSKIPDERKTEIRQKMRQKRRKNESVSERENRFVV